MSQKPTKSLNTALKRMMEAVPDGRMVHAEHGKRTIHFTRPHGPIEETGTVSRCLYMVIMAATTKAELGGLGMDRSEVSEIINLMSSAIPKTGLGAHEHNVFYAVAR